MEVTNFFRLMVDKEASDMFFSVGAPISMKVEGKMRPVMDTVLTPGSVKKIAYALMNEDQIKEFEATLEMNFGASLPGLGRFRLNVYRQRGEVAMVARYVKSHVPSIEELRLPAVVKDLIMQPRGLVLVVGATGMGKSTSLASMIDHRNMSSADHILTIEDPIEYMHENKRSIVDQREVGIDTLSFGNALVNAVREAPDVILIGEIRDAETMHHALAFADSGHLCLSTLHANNADQAMDRIINFFPKEGQSQLLVDLSLNLRGIIAQRLVVGKDGKRVPAVEVLLNTPHIAELIENGKMGEIKEAMTSGKDPNVRTFDQALFRLFKQGLITKEEALRQADSANDLNLRIRFSGDEEAAAF